VYCKNSCGSSPQNTGYTGQHPALAFSEGRLHLVWDTSSDANSLINYAREDSPGDGTWNGGSAKSWWQSPPPSVLYHEPSYPAIGASGSAVYVVWAVQRMSNPSEYALVFDFSQDSGASWLPGTSDLGRSIPENEIGVAPDASTWFAAGQPADELYSLQPDVVVTGTGASAYAHLVWHGRQYSPSKYSVWYSSLEGYDDTRPWRAPEAVKVASDESRPPSNRGLPAIAVGAVLSQTHVALVEDASASYFGRIDVWYFGDNGNRDNDENLGEGPIWLPVIMKNH